MFEIYHGDCKEIYPEIKSKVDIVITDPPYNINFKYNKYNDDLSDNDYINLISIFKGMPMAICQYPEETMRFIAPALGVPDEVLAWCYSSNINRQFRLINIYNKKVMFDRVKQPYKNPTDKRVKKIINKQISNGEEPGTRMYDWFSDIQLEKNVNKKRTGNIHPCPLPLKLLERLIILTTNEGDTVLDPFLGSGTTMLACKNLGRNCIGIELDKEYIDYAVTRMGEKFPLTIHSDCAMVYRREP